MSDVGWWQGGQYEYSYHFDEVVEQLKLMPQHLQWQVLEFVRALVKAEVRSTPGQQLLCFADSIPTDDLQVMREEIEQDCELTF
jgi:hypothetical protein